MNPEKEKYIEATEHLEIPIFFRPYFIEACSYDCTWDVRIIEHNKQLVAAFIFYSKTDSLGMRIHMPHLSKFAGPLFIQDDPDSAKREKILSKLISRVPAFSNFNLCTHYNLTNWLPFHRQGFSQTTRYSYVITKDETQVLYKNLKVNYRNKIIPQASQNLQIVHDRSLDDFYSVHKSTYQKRAAKYPFAKNQVQKFISEIETQGVGKRFYAVDSTGQIHSVVFLVWDAHSSYSIIIGNNAQLANASGASIYILWECIKYSFEILGVQQFDFLGSMIPAVEKIRLNFGAKASPYNHIYKANSLVYKLQNAKNRF